ncbi:MAG: MMPL family transporter [Pseudomonadota bacterium]
MTGRALNPSRTERALARLGAFCWDRHLWVLSAWVIATVAAVAFIAAYSDRLVSGAGSIEGSQSAHVDAELAETFGVRESQALVLTYRDPSIDLDEEARYAFIEEVETGLADIPQVEGILPADGLIDQPRDDKGHAVIIALATNDALEAEQMVPVVRQRLGGIAESRSQLEWAISGRSAVSYDLTIFSNEDSARSELRALPLALLVLLYAFGALLSASLPIILALTARTVAFAAIVAVAGFFEISTVSQAIVTMLAIALGIDYSLFVYHRYRQLLSECGACTPDEINAERRNALISAMCKSGTVVVYSGVAVAIGMTSLVLTPMMEMRSIGWGGLTAVIFSVAVALTMLPALLALIGAKALDWPGKARPGRGYEANSARWTQWGHNVVKRPWLAIACSLCPILLMAAPSAFTQFGFPEEQFFPAELESVRGVQMLEEMEIKGLSAPIFVIISRDDGQSVITSDSAGELRDFKARIETDPRIAEVYSPRLSTRRAFSPIPMSGPQNLVSENGDKVLFRVIPQTETSLVGLRDLVRDVPSWLSLPGYSVEVGGQAQFLNDFDDGVIASYAPVMIAVLLATGLALLLMLGAPLASFKALVLNLLSVATGYGVVVFVFQLGYGAHLFGVAGATQTIPSSVPVVIFAVLFGLSMDYEIFLVSRMKDLYLQTGDNERSIIDALADTGSVISSAALIMALVFGVFAFSRVIIVQMVGLGLATAILVDALIIRAVLGPALMTLAGNLNWWPLRPASAQPAE